MVRFFLFVMNHLLVVVMNHMAMVPFMPWLVRLGHCRPSHGYQYQHRQKDLLHMIVIFGGKQ